MKLFEKVDPKKVKPGAPPLVCYPAVTGRILFETQEDLKAWEDEVRTRLGIEFKGNLGTTTETTEAGCTGDTDL